MIFNEIYSAYYNAVAKIITSIISGQADEENIRKIICENAFGESMLAVWPALKNEKWQLVKENLTTPLRHIPTLPLTTIEKQWLKAISLDPRIKLFDIDFQGLEDIQPLFTSEDYYIYDKYNDGDPFYDEEYIKRFRTILSALKDHQPLQIQMKNRNGNLVSAKVMPQWLEYSEKDDKFRLISSRCRYAGMVNLGRITACKRCHAEGYKPHAVSMQANKALTLCVYNERNALERVLLHFAHFAKRVERVDEKKYLVHIKYQKSDEIEMVIRTLSFGPLVEAVAPNEFKNLIIARLKSQKSCKLI